MTMKQEAHRPGTLKQSNKQHKTGRHRSKSVINSFKGKIYVLNITKYNKLPNFIKIVFYYMYFYFILYLCR